MGGPESPHAIQIYNNSKAVIAGNFVNTFSTTVNGALTTLTHTTGSNGDHIIYSLQPICGAYKSGISCRADVGRTGRGSSLCVAGKYKDNAVSNEACKDCPSNTGTGAQTGSVSISDCLANAGYTGSGPSPCAAGKYKDNAVSNEACKDCPFNTGTGA